MDLQENNSTIPADLRARIARKRVSLFKLAAVVGIHPSNLGQTLNERRPMDSGVAKRVLDAIDSFDQRGV